MECRERMEQYLTEQGVEYEVTEHELAYTMPEVAATLHVPGKQVAKTVMVQTDQGMAMIVVPSHLRVSLTQVRNITGTSEARLAKEGEFAGMFPDCVVGAMPPFGNLYNIPVYVDRNLTAQQDIIFRIGTHRHTMRVAYADYRRLVRPREGQFAF